MPLPPLQPSIHFVYSFCLFIHFVYLFCLFIYLFFYLFIYFFIYFVYLFIYLYIHLLIYLFIHFVYLFIYLFIFFNAEKFHQTLARLESQHAQFMGRSGKPLSSSKYKAQHQYKYMTPDVLKHFFGMKFWNFIILRCLFTDIL